MSIFCVFCIFCNGIVQLSGSPAVVLHTRILGGVHPPITYRFLYRVCILSFGVCSIFELLACGGVNRTTNLAVLDLSPYGFVFKKFSLQALILNKFWGFLFFVTCATIPFAHSRNNFAQLDIMDRAHPITTKLYKTMARVQNAL